MSKNDVVTVELIAHTPSPDLVCDMAAEVCVSRDAPTLESREIGCRHLRAALAGGHDSVLEHAGVSFLITGVDRVTEIQLVRHRLASYAIQSGRYCSRDPTNMSDPLGEDVTDELGALVRYYKDTLVSLDDAMKGAEVPPEDRRFFYPQGLRTNIMVTMNLRELRHFLGVRMCVRAQRPIREIANGMYKLVQEIAPICAEYMGPQCEAKGYCPEARSCKRHPTMEQLREAWNDKWVKDNDGDCDLFVCQDTPE